jgi:putative redox protein
MKAQISWMEEGRFEGNTQDGRTVAFDVHRKTAASPMETLLLALGACSAGDVIHILEKRRQDVKALRIRLKGERRQEHPRRFTQVSLHFEIEGEDLEEEWVEKATRLSTEKYCSVLSSMREGGVTAEVSHEVLP